jgi:hypothetical protein
LRVEGIVMNAIVTEKADNLPRLKKGLERLAYISLAADIAISSVTLAYQSTHLGSLINVEFFLGDILALIVAASLIVLAAIAVLSIGRSSKPV